MLTIKIINKEEIDTTFSNYDLIHLIQRSLKRGKSELVLVNCVEDIEGTAYKIKKFFSKTKTNVLGNSIICKFGVNNKKL